MKRIYTLFLVVFYTLIFSQISVTYTTSPSVFSEEESVTLTISGVDENAFGVASSHKLYLWAWSFDASNTSKDCPTNGSWSDSNEANALSYTGNGTYQITFVPKDFFVRTGITKFGFLLKNKNGGAQSQDMIINMDNFSLRLNSPLENSTKKVNAGDAVRISAVASAPSNFVLKVNGKELSAGAMNNTSTYEYSYIAMENASVELVATNVANTQQVKRVGFSIVVDKQVVSEAMPSWMREGINYSSDNTKVGLALYAPGKDYVNVIGDFNGWEVSDAYLMKRDTANPNLFWIEIGGLVPQKMYAFQYKTSDLRVVADPYSPLILSSYDDKYIPATTYPNLPSYPLGQDFEASVIQTGMPSYNWQVTNFERPAKDNLVIYEVLLRDFTTEKTWQSLINKIDYIKSLNVNAIELMPIMEFEGNASWGYNTSFHYALDKAYGTPEMFKKFVDECHKKGLAVILDIAFNHATGRSPLARLWNDNQYGNGYGKITADNPYFNQTATHEYAYFEDFNHQSEKTQYYVKRVLEHWIKEYKIDGFRWDLTKGFTQNCTGNQNCTDTYQQDRVDILKKYADYQWANDSTSYIIFEHLGTDEEEKQWTDYKDGIMVWNKLNSAYNQNTMGYVENSDFGKMDYESRGFSKMRAMNFGESHDEERLMFKNLQYGATNGSYSVKNLSTALERQKAFGAVFLTIPGPKMIWQFGELGYEFSINRCEDGTIKEDCRTAPKPIAFELGYDNDAERKSVYDTWAKILSLRKNNKVFSSNTFTIESGSLTPRIYIWDDSIPISDLKNIVILANFTTSTQQVIPHFPYSGNWKNLMDDTSLEVYDTASPITLKAGEFRIFGNTTSSLSTKDTISTKSEVNLLVMENPTTGNTIKVKYSNAKNGKIHLYNSAGQLLHIFSLKGENGQEVLQHHLSKGLYTLQLVSEKGKAESKIIVR